MPESMKEKLAQIIAEAAAGYMGAAPTDQDFHAVDAILAAMSEPSEAMLLIGEHLQFDDREAGARDVWQAMLKAAGEE